MTPLFELRWIEMPAPQVLERLNKVWYALDCDAPRLTENGLCDGWRSPLFSFAVLAGVLHALGWPCRFRSCPDIYAIHERAEWWERCEKAELRELEAQPWQDSTLSALLLVQPWEVWRFKRISRTLHKLLPPAALRPPKGRRCFGKRRRFKRWRATDYVGTSWVFS